MINVSSSNFDPRTGVGNLMQGNDILSRLVSCSENGARIGVITDIDGTISPIASSPDAAQVSPRSRVVLAALSRRIALVAAITGRGAQDAHDKLGLDHLVYVGNHGFERWHDGAVEVLPSGRSARPAIQRILDAVRTTLPPGMIVEDKGATVSFHYRQVQNPQYVRESIQPLIERLARENGLSSFAGRMVIEMRPSSPVDKGTALESLIADYRLQAAVFLGDDTTDAAAMIAMRTLRESGRCDGYSLGVESHETPAIVRESADAFLPGVPGVEDWLESLASALGAI